MTLVLDTNVLVEVYRGNNPMIDSLKRLRSAYPGNLAITFATFSEFYYGCLNRPRRQREESLEWLHTFDILHTTDNSAKIFAEIKRALTGSGKMIPVFDILIASIAMDSKAVLATTDAHFKNISGLSLNLFNGEHTD